MEDVESVIARLERQADEIRIRAIETNKALVAEMSQLWHELNEHAEGRPEVRHKADLVAADIARLEKLDFELDNAWLAESQREHEEAEDAS